MTIVRRLMFTGILAAMVCSTGRAQQPVGLASIHATALLDLRTWDAFVDSGSRAGDLRLSSVVADPSVPQRSVERYQQFYQGVPVWGANVVRDTENGVTASIFGEVLPPASTIDTAPAIAIEQARDTFTRLAGPGGVLVRDAELTIAVLPSGESRLAYMAVIGGRSFPTRVFLDAQTGDELFRISEMRSQAPLGPEVAVGTGRGLLGDLRKISAKKEGSAYFLDDQLRPPLLDTFDMKNNLTHAMSVVLGGTSLLSTDRATDSDNVWTDVAVVDAHANVGLTYDYYFQRFGRRGLDDHDRPLVTITNAVSQSAARSLSTSLIGTWAINAFWCDLCGPGGVGVIFLGNGAQDVTAGGHAYTYFAGALDVVGHELTHGVTSSTSNLTYLNESGALNESFSDMMGTSIEFYYQPPGSGPGRADYALGEDISKAVGGATTPDGDRSMENPGLYGDPDHYSKRLTGPADNGGVHQNSGISNNAFYLAIEGGANRTSGLTVQGVGAANREQIEKVFYRAFVFLLPSSATFSTARSATIQAARDLYGSGSAAERAVTQAWTAVGVN